MDLFVLGVSLWLSGKLLPFSITDLFSLAALLQLVNHAI
jgi:hypothetical protein